MATKTMRYQLINPTDDSILAEIQVEVTPGTRWNPKRLPGGLSVRDVEAVITHQLCINVPRSWCCVPGADHLAIERA